MGGKRDQESSQYFYQRRNLNGKSIKHAHHAGPGQPDAECQSHNRLFLGEQGSYPLHQTRASSPIRSQGHFNLGPKTETFCPVEPKL